MIKKKKSVEDKNDVKQHHDHSAVSRMKNKIHAMKNTELLSQEYMFINSFFETLSRAA